MEQRLKEITDFIFISTPPQKAGLIIVPGTFRLSLVEKVVELYNQGFCKKIITTGAPTNEQKLTEAEFQKQYLVSKNIPEEIIYTETKSTNTKANAIMAKKVAEKNNLNTNNIIIPAKTYHCRRAYMTFKNVFQGSTINMVPVIDDRNITRENWYKTKQKRRKVMQEVGKISKYYLKGDLVL